MAKTKTPPGPTGSYPLEYCSTDRAAVIDGQCHWGLVLARDGNEVLVLTTIGVRYYVLGTGDVRVVGPDDADYATIDLCWRAAIAKVADLQRYLPRHLKGSTAPRDWP